MPYYQVTLNQGRTDTITAEFDSVSDCRAFYEAVSTAKITSIKKIVFSKELGVGSAVTTYTPNNQNSYLNVLVKSKKGYTGTINISFPIKTLTEDKIIKTIKKYLTINGDEITDILNIIVAIEGSSPTGA